MKNKVKKKLFGCTFAALVPTALKTTFMIAPLFCSQPATAGQYGFSKDTLSALFETSYFITKANYDAFGNYAGLTSGNQFSEWRFILSASYDFSNKFGVYAKGSFKRTDAIANTGIFGTAGLAETTDTNFSDFVVGANYLLLSRRGFNLIPDLSLVIPTYGQAGSINGPLLGDGAFVVTGKLSATKKLSSFLFDVYGGFSYRTYGFSSLIPYGGLIQADASSFFFEAAVNGAVSLNNDQYTTNPLYRLSYANAFDAGSLVYDATNPSWINGDLTVGLRFSPEYYMTVGIDQSLIGYATAQGTRFLVGFGYGTEPTRLARLHGGGIGDDLRGSQNFEVDTDVEDDAARPKKLKATPVQDRSRNQGKTGSLVQ